VLALPLAAVGVGVAAHGRAEVGGGVPDGAGAEPRLRRRKVGEDDEDAATATGLGEMEIGHPRRPLPLLPRPPRRVRGGDASPRPQRQVFPTLPSTSTHPWEQFQIFSF
jgi:hypothetical protein